MKPSSIVLILLCLAAAPAGAQQVYSWTDANGTKHFSDTPPPPNTTSAKKLVVRGGVTSAEEDAAAKIEGEPKEGPKMAAAAGYSEADIKRNCAAAQKNLTTFEASKPGDDADADDQARYQADLSKVQDQIKLFCG
ncbi:MAG: DUF4124 domain-containing protein [Dokdonella sp.]|uniref:DUF4124 domain-containing protein n=1 Tax=Dokdonella sp. TaxID=2291710 RepID=UPI002C9F816F|nr:DUF4124 domain-containing protein [Dokdonella sp.]HPG94017.1 DUF4124 domain-containing protein [Dokdonella sp.]HPN78425.1 DUF4124 domain-containing protein [Dokdonella sp.]